MQDPSTHHNIASTRHRRCPLMAREKLTLPDDDALVIKLDFGPEGVEYPSKYGKGTEFMYTVNDDQNIIYLKPEAREAVMNSGAEAGNEIAITKRRVGRNTEYFVEILGDAQEPAPPPARATRPPLSEHFPERQRVARPGPQAVARRDSNRAASPALARNTSEDRQPYQREAHHQRPNIYPLMDRSMRAACNSLKETCDFAASIGLPLDAITVEDVRTVAITIFIEECKR